MIPHEHEPPSGSGDKPPEFNPNLAWQIAILAALIAFIFIGLTGCSSAPLKAGMPHSIQTNRFLANYEIRLKGSEERIIVGHYDLERSPGRQRIDGDDNLVHRRSHGATDLHYRKPLR